MRVYVRFPLLTLLYALALNAALLGFLSTTDVAAREGAAPLSFISEHDIIITKTVVGATPALSWTFDIESTTEVTRLIVPPTGGTAWHSVHLEERTITITEQSQTGYLVNYVCYREQPEGELDYEFEEITRGQGNQVVLSGFGEFDLTLHCAFTNTQLAKVTIIKEANPADGTDFGFETDLPFNGPPLLDGSLASEGTRAGQVLSPYGLAIDTAGNIFVADESNNRIQKFDSNGNFLRAWGWGVDDSTATFQICTAGCRAGLEGNGAGQFDRPRNIAINSAGHVYVTDAANDRVQVFDSNGIFQFSWGSSGTAESQFTFPNGIAVDSVDNVYIADNNHRVQKFAANGDFLLMWGRGVKDGATTHQICTAVDAPCQQGTTGTGAGQFRFPHSIAINSADHVYVSDRLNNRIQRFTVDGDYVDEWNGTNSASGALNSPRALTVDPDDNLLIIDNNKYRVVKLTSDWTFIIEWGTFGRVPGYFFEPSGIAVAADGTIYVSDEVNHLIQKFTDIDLTLDHALPDDLDSITMSATTYVTGGLYAITETHIAAGWSFDSVACESAGPGAAPAVNSATVNFDLAMTQIVTCTYTNRSRGDLTIVKQANPDTADPFDIVVTTLVTKTLLYESFSDFGPGGIAQNSQGHIYVALLTRNQIIKYNSNLTPLLVWGASGTEHGEFQVPIEVAIDGNDHVYVVDSENHRVQKFDAQGAFLTAFGAPGTGKGELLYPLAIAIDANNDVYVSDASNNRLVKFDSSGVFLRMWGWGVLDGANTFQVCTSAHGSCQVGLEGQGAGQFKFMMGLAMTGDDRLYVVDEGRIQIFDPDGTLLDAFAISTSNPNDPAQVVVDSDDNAYVSFLDGGTLARYDSSGNFQGLESLFPTQLDMISDLLLDSQGVFYVTGADHGLPSGLLLRQVPMPLQDDQSQTLTDLPNGSYTIVEDLPAGWRLLAASCEGGVYTTLPNGLSVQVTDNADIVCTLENAQTAELTVVKETLPAAGTGFSFTVAGPPHTISYLDQWGTDGTGVGEFNAPSWITVDEDGNVYVTDDRNHRIQKFDADGNFLRMWGWGVNGGAGFEICTAPGPCLAGTAGAGAGQFEFPNGVAASVAQNRVYVADGENPRIQVFDNDGAFLFMWGWGVNGGIGLEVCAAPGPCFAGDRGDGAGQFVLANGIALDSAGNVYVADTAASRVQKFDSNGDFVSMWGSGVNGGSGYEVCSIATNCVAAQEGANAGEFSHPSDITVDGSDFIYVVDSDNNFVSKFDSNGSFQRTWGWGVDSGAGFEICVAPGPCLAGVAGTAPGQFDDSHGIFADALGNVYVADDDNNRIQKFDSDGNFLAQWGYEGTGSGEFADPDDVAVSTNGRIYVMEEDSNRVQVFIELPISFALDDGQSMHFAQLTSGDYSITETELPAGWQFQSASCTNGDSASSVTLQAGDIVTCTVTNVVPPTLTVVKETIGGDGSFDFSSPQLDPFRLTTVQGVTETTFTVDAGTYAITETVPPGWQLVSATCEDANAPKNISLAYGDSVTCTFMNHKLATIHIVKETIGAEGSFDFTSPQLDDFGLTTVNGSAATSFTVRAGTYSITETVPAEWNLTDTRCGDDQQPQNFTVGYGEAITCTFTNSYIEQSLTVEKVVVGGPLTGADFPLFINDSQVSSGESVALTAGDYTVSETSQPTYAAAYSGDCDVNGNVTLGIGEHLTCTITNSYIEQSLTVEKVVVGGPLTVADFPLFINDSQISSGESVALTAGDYTVSETSQPTYAAAYSGDCDVNGNVTLGIGEHLTCTVTNSYIEQSLTVEKVVVGGPLTVADFPLFINDSQVSSGQKVALPAGDYTISESGVATYTATFGGDCDARGTVTLSVGQQLTCIITNTAQAATLTVVKSLIGAPPATDWLFTGEPEIGAITLPATGGQQSFTLAAGQYTLSESTQPDYSASVSCTNGATGDERVTIELLPGDEVTCTFLNEQAVQPASAGIVVTKTVGTRPELCATTSELVVPQNATVYYCYAVQNTGDVTLTQHTVVDDLLGAFALSFDLAPGATRNTVELGLVVTDTANITKTNTVTWTANNGEVPVQQISTSAIEFFEVSATDQATVMPAEIGTLVTKVAGLMPDSCNDVGNAVMDPGTQLYYCVTITNSGQISLSHHRVVDPMLNIDVTIEHHLRPGESVSLTNVQIPRLGPFAVTQNITNSVTVVSTLGPEQPTAPAFEAAASAVAPVQVMEPTNLTPIDQPLQPKRHIIYLPLLHNSGSRTDVEPVDATSFVGDLGSATLRAHGPGDNSPKERPLPSGTHSIHLSVVISSQGSGR